MITEKEIIEILNEWEFGANLKNGEFVRGVKNEYYKNVARAIVSKNESLHLVSGCSLEEMQSLRKVYKKRFEMCARNDNYREAHEENIKVGVMDLLISKSNNH